MPKVFAAAAGGWLPTEKHAWAVLLVWLIVVLAHAIYRSRGEAKPDPIRPPGPMLE